MPRQGRAPIWRTVRPGLKKMKIIAMAVSGKSDIRTARTIAGIAARNAAATPLGLTNNRTRLNTYVSRI